MTSSSRASTLSLAAVMHALQEELHTALQQLVDAMVSTGCALPGGGGRRACALSCDTAGIAHYLRALALDHGLRRFVIVWIATALASARVQAFQACMCNLADAAHYFSRIRGALVGGFAAEGACTALVAALRAAESDFRRKLIADALSCLASHHSFSKSCGLRSIPVSIEEWMARLTGEHTRFDLHDAIFFMGEVERYSDGGTEFPRSLWELALDAHHAGALVAVVRAFFASLQRLAPDTARDMLARAVHAHRKARKGWTQREWMHRRLGWYQEHHGHVVYWKPTNFCGSAVHVKFLAALAAEGVLLELMQALTCAENHDMIVSLSLAISALAFTGSAGVGRDAEGRVAAGQARDVLRKRLIGIWVPAHVKLWHRACSDEEHVVVESRGASEDFQNASDNAILTAALGHLGGDGQRSAAVVQRVQVRIKPVPIGKNSHSSQLRHTNWFAFHGQHVFCDGSRYDGQWINAARDQPPHPPAEDLTNDCHDPRKGLRRLSCNYEMDGGKMHGKGVMVYCNGDSYRGEWVEGKKSGWGVYRWKNGDFIQGEWFEGMHVFPITRHALHANKHAAFLQKFVRCRLARKHFQKLRTKFLLRGHSMLNGCCNAAERSPMSRDQALFFALPLADFVVQAGCAARLRLAAGACFRIRQRAARFRPLNLTLLLHAARRSTRGCLSAVSNTQLCRNRCGEVVLLADRLVWHPVSMLPSMIISESCLRRCSACLLERVFRGYCRRIFQNIDAYNKDTIRDIYTDFHDSYENYGTMEEVD
jgi:hypothetical protein